MHIPIKYIVCTNLYIWYLRTLSRMLSLMWVFSNSPGWLQPKPLPQLTGQFSYHLEITVPNLQAVFNSHVSLFFLSPLWWLSGILNLVWINGENANEHRGAKVNGVRVNRKHLYEQITVISCLSPLICGFCASCQSALLCMPFIWSFEAKVKVGIVSYVHNGIVVSLCVVAIGYWWWYCRTWRVISILL